MILLSSPPTWQRDFDPSATRQMSTSLFEALATHSPSAERSEAMMLGRAPAAGNTRLPLAVSVTS
jgi:hypothetical protein